MKIEESEIVYLTELPEDDMRTPYDGDFAEEMALAGKIMREDRDILHELTKR